MNLKDKTILVTGATGGIGSILASHLKEKGASLILLGRDQSKLDLLGQTLKATTYTCDLANRTNRQEFIKELSANHPHIDILINCAGIGIYKLGKDITPEDWYQSYELNVHTPFFFMQNLQPQYTLNVGSCSALQHVAQRSLYNSTKAALRSLSLSLSQEFPGKITHVTLDSTLTPFGPLTLTEKESKQKDGKFYLSPAWVASKLIEILSSDNLEPEYCLSPECYDKCGIWLKP